MSTIPTEITAATEGSLDIASIKSVMDGFDPASLLPDLSKVFGSLVGVCRVAVMIGPVIALILGLAYLFLAPKEANYYFGYRCYFGMGSVRAWRFTQRIAGMILGGLGLILTVIMAIVTCYVLSRVRHFKLGALTDLVVMGLLIGQTVGRWGNFMNREAFGGETTLPWRMELLTKAGEAVDVHPTFLYESLWNVVGLLLIVFIVSKARRFDGENTWFYFLWYGLGRFWIEGLRTDSLYLFDWTIGGQPIRVSQALSLVMVLVSAFMLLYHLKLHPHKPEELYVNQAQPTEEKTDE